MLTSIIAQLRRHGHSPTCAKYGSGALTSKTQLEVASDVPGSEMAAETKWKQVLSKKMSFSILYWYTVTVIDL